MNYRSVFSDGASCLFGRRQSQKLGYTFLQVYLGNGSNTGTQLNPRACSLLRWYRGSISHHPTRGLHLRSDARTFPFSQVGNDRGSRTA
jgi:hypothetical protein